MVFSIALAEEAIDIIRAHESFINCNCLPLFSSRLPMLDAGDEPSW